MHALQFHRFGTAPPTSLARSATPTPVVRGSTSGPETALPVASSTAQASPPERGSREHGGGVEGQVDLALLREAGEELQAELNALGKQSLKIDYEEEADRFVVSVVDVETEEVIRQIPAEALLAALLRLEELRGLLFDGHS